MFDLGHQSFPALRLELKNQLLLGLQPVRFQTGTYTIGSPGSQVFEVGLKFKLLILAHLVLRPLNLDWNNTIKITNIDCFLY